VRDRETDVFKGIAYVEFGNRDDLLQALDLDGVQIEVPGGHYYLRVDVAAPKRGRDGGRGRGGGGGGRGPPGGQQRGPPMYDRAPPRGSGGGGGGGRGGGRGYENPIPDGPPFTAFVGDLPRTINESELAQLFMEDKPRKIVEVRLLKDRDTGEPKGVGYVEFESRDDLCSALTLHGMPFQGRQLRVDVAAPRRGSSDGDSPRGGFGGPGGRPPMRSSGAGEDRAAWEGTTESRAARPRLKLQKRSVQAPVGGKSETAGSSIFGGAKPREEGTTEYDKKMAAMSLKDKGGKE